MSSSVVWLHFIPLIGFTHNGDDTPWRRDKTHIHSSPEYEASAQFMHVRQLLTAPCISTAQQSIIYYSVGFPLGKELDLLELCNQIWSEICDLLGLYTS